MHPNVDSSYIIMLKLQLAGNVAQQAKYLNKKESKYEICYNMPLKCLLYNNASTQKN